MRDLQRRAVLIGAGVLAAVVGAPLMNPGPARAEPTSTDADLALLRRTFALAVEARQSGNTPFAALVADAGVNVIVERGNESAPPDGDPTRHAEVVATAAAWHVLGDDGMNQATLYKPENPTFSLPCRDVLAHGQRPIAVIGSLLEAEAAVPHEGYWH
jgi:hypothetical protein